MQSGDIQFLNQLMRSLDEAGKSLEKAYERKDFEKFNKARKIILNLQKEISEIIK